MYNVFRTSILLLCFIPMLVWGQTVKNISVSADTSYTDHIALRKDSKDTDILVKFVFDEANEQLTVSLISYRRLFVFREDARYKQVVRGKKLRPDLFPYVTDAEKGQQFRLSYDLRKSIPKPKKAYIFRRWLSYDGLIPVDGEVKMVNDFIEQKFDIKNRLDLVRVRLRDVFLMDQDERKANRFWVTYGKDLDTEYQVTLRRDPCFGKAEDITVALTALNNLRAGFRPFYNRYKSGKVSSDDMLSTFKKSKETLLQQFPAHTVNTQCETLRSTWEQYNQTIDSLVQMQCTIEASAPLADGVVQGGVQSSFLNSCTRKLDTLVSQWLLTSVAAQREDLKSKGEDLIKSVHDNVKQQGVISKEQQNAYNLFKTAERYFKITCH